MLDGVVGRGSIFKRLALRFLQGDIERMINAAVKVRVDDSPGWDTLQPGPADRPWSERADDLDDALEAWRKNFMVRHLVTLTRSYVVGNGITVSSEVPAVEQFLRAFWDHPQNRMSRRLGPMCDELVRAGEVFPILFTNRVNGMSYVRFVPASRIRELETDEDDYEVELRYGEMQHISIEPKWHIGPGHAKAFKRVRGGAGGKLLPLMLHFSVNKVVGATRGEGDLGPILPWARRYAQWLGDRVRLNRRRTRQGLLDIEIADPAMVEVKRQQFQTSNPIEAGIYVHGPGEKVSMHSLNIRADDAEADGKVLRLAIAAGSNTALHYLGEGGEVNYATAKEMGEPTSRFFTERQGDMRVFVVDLVEAAYKRAVAMGQAVAVDDLAISTSVSEVARADNAGLALAAKDIVEALQGMRLAGWIDDETAVKLAFKFAGEPLGEEEVKRILEGAVSQIAPAEKAEDQ